MHLFAKLKKNYVKGIHSMDGSCHILRKKDHIKYLGVMIDESLSWKYHISYICSRVSRNIGIISKLRHYLSIHQLKQIYYNLIYPYLSYAVIAWGSAYKTHLQKLQTKPEYGFKNKFFLQQHLGLTLKALSLS